MPEHRPYFGDWITVSRTFDDADVGVNDMGEYRRFGTVKVGHQALAPQGMSEADFTHEYTLFERPGVDYELVDRNVDPPQPLRLAKWRPRAISPAWRVLIR